MQHYTPHERYSDPRKAAEVFEKLHAEFLNTNASRFEPTECIRMQAPLFAAYQPGNKARLHVTVLENDHGTPVGINCLMIYDDPACSMLVYSATHKEGPEKPPTERYSKALYDAALEAHDTHFGTLQNVPLFVEIPCYKNGHVENAKHYEERMGLQRVNIRWDEPSRGTKTGYTLAVRHNGNLPPATVLALMEDHARFVSGVVKGQAMIAGCTPYFGDPAGTLEADHEFADMKKTIDTISERYRGEIPVESLIEAGRALRTGNSRDGRC